MSDFAKRAEQSAAKRHGGRRQPGSGRFHGRKGDVDVAPTTPSAGDGWLIEQKATQAASLRVEHAWLAKLSGQAGAQRRQPAFRMVFGRGDGEPKPSGEWIAVPAWRFEEMREKVAAYDQAVLDGDIR